MKLAYFILSFFVLSISFCCQSEATAVDNTNNYQSVVDTIITFDPVTYEESIQVVRYKVSEDGKDTVDYALENWGTRSLKTENLVEESVKIVKDNETGAVDTVVTFSIRE